MVNTKVVLPFIQHSGHTQAFGRPHRYHTPFYFDVDKAAVRVIAQFNKTKNYPYTCPSIH